MDPDRRSVVLGLASVAGVGVMACGPDQVRPDLYNCEGCEAVAERSARAISPTARLAGSADGQLLTVTGRVFGADGRTPAAGVVIYAHQANAQGLYADGSTETIWSRRHGRLRGWVRTDEHGAYRFDTIKPAPYPSMTIPAHIHFYVGEPGRRPYYIDDIVFDGEFGVDQTYRARQELRGGSGIVTLGRDGFGGLLARRDIRLERHPVQA